MPLYHNQRAEDEADQARLQFADSPDVLGAMGSYYGTNLKDQVNIHNDESAHEMVAKEGVDAVASGSDIYFGQGAYDMGNRDSRGLLAHEAAHVIQQGGLLGMNQSSPYGARQGGILDSIGNFFATAAVSLVSGIGGALAGLFWRSNIGGTSIRRDVAKNIQNVIVDKKAFKLELINHQKRKGYSANPFKITNGFVKLDDGLTTYAGDGESGASHQGLFSMFKRALTAPDIGVEYDFRDSQNLKDSAEKSFNNASQYVGTLKHRLLSSTIIGSIIYFLINWNVHYLRRAWPVRIVTGVVRQIGTWGVGLWQALKWIAGKITRNENLKSNSAKWWNKNAGSFFLPFIGDKVHNFINWARKRLSRGPIKKNVLIQNRADDDAVEAIMDIEKIREKDSLDSSYGGSLSHIPDDTGMGMPAELTPIVPGQSEAPAPSNEADKEDDPNAIIEGEPTAADLEKVNLPDQAKAELIGGMLDPGKLNELSPEEKNQLFKDIASDDRALHMLMNELTPAEKERIESLTEKDLSNKSKGNNNEQEVIDLNDESIQDEAKEAASNGQLPMPMMPPIVGPQAKSGPVTFQNADEALGDGWEEKPEDTEKRDESFEEVLLYSTTLGNSVTEMLRNLKIATENGNTLKADSLTIYEQALEAVNKLDDSTEDTRVAKAWAMRFLRCINKNNNKKAA